jgi:uracil-DNA glycosylase
MKQNEIDLYSLLGQAWYNILSEDTKKKLIVALEQVQECLDLGEVICPEKKNVLRVFKAMSPHEIKVLILGQDPYYTRCPVTKQLYADGFAFSTPDTNSVPKSLQIILDAIEKEYYFSEGFREPRQNISTDLTRWVNQGVFLLNTALTVRLGTSLSHNKIWYRFTIGLLKDLSIALPDIVYLLWGNEAKALKEFIHISTHRRKILEDIHPNAVSYNPTLTFNGKFEAANRILIELNKTPIIW